MIEIFVCTVIALMIWDAIKAFLKMLFKGSVVNDKKDSK